MAEPWIPILHTALGGRCPRCGKGKLFKGLLTLQPDCLVVLGAFVGGMAFWVDFHLSSPLWVHALLWPAVTISLTVMFIRPMKAVLVAVQFRHWPHEMGL